MVSMETLGLFSVAALSLLLLPGPAVLYIVARSAGQGRRAGLVSVLGIHLGTIVHVAAALVGLSAVVVASATAFTVVKLAGAAYLAYLGVRALLTARQMRSVETEVASQDRSLRRIFVDGVVLNVLNPKTAVFFLAFVPQFVSTESSASATGQLLVLSAVFIGLGLITDAAYALAGSWVSERLAASPGIARRKEVASGVTYLGLAAITAAAD